MNEMHEVDNKCLMQSSLSPRGQIFLPSSSDSKSRHHARHRLVNCNMNIGICARR